VSQLKHGIGVNCVDLKSLWMLEYISPIDIAMQAIKE